MKIVVGTVSLAVTLGVLGCTADETVASVTPDLPHPSQIVFVPDAGHETELIVEMNRSDGDDGAINVNAIAVSGPWRQVKYAEIDPCSTWFVRPMERTDITHAVTWITDSPVAVKFNEVTDLSSGTGWKTVHLSGPGEFQVWASTDFPTSATSNTLLVTID